MGVKNLTGIARRLRENSTNTEQYLWKHLRNRQVEGFKFRRQQQLGKHIVDFVNLENKVVVEVDGGQHVHNSNDKIRDEWLRAEGYKVLRFWDNEVFNNLESVLESPLTLTLSHKGRGKIIFDNTLEDIRVRSYVSIRNMVVLLLAVSYFAAVYLGQNLRLKLLVERIFLVSKRFFGAPSFFNLSFDFG